MSCLAIKHLREVQVVQRLCSPLQIQMFYSIGKLPSTGKHHISVIGIRNCVDTPYVVSLLWVKKGQRPCLLSMPSQEQLVLEDFLEQARKLGLKLS